MRPLKEFVEDRSLIDRKGLGTGESEVDLSEDSPVESGIAELRSRVLAAFNLQILEIKSSIATSFDSLGAYDLSAVTRIVNAKLDSFVSQLLRDGKLNLGVNDELVHTQIELPDDLARFLEIIEFISELFGRINSLKAEASLKKVGFEAKVVGARDDLEVLNEIPISRRGEEWKRGESRALGTVERFDRKASGTKRRIRVLDSKCQSVLNSVGSFEELEAALEELIVFLKSGWIEGREAKAMLADMHSNGGVDRDLFAADFSTRVNGGARTGVAKRVRSSRSRVVALAAAIGGAAALLATIVLTNSPTKSTKPVKIPSGSELKAGPGLMAGKYADYFGEGSVEKARDYLRDIY